MAFSHADLLQKIITPDPENAEQILTELGLHGPPNIDQVHREIERRLLLPPQKFPTHWLPYLQK